VKRDSFNLGDNVEDFISFSAAIFNAVALAWDNELMWNDLIAYHGGPGQPRKRTITLLNEWLGYSYPWDLDLFIQEDKKARYDSSKGLWVDTTPPVLMLTLPWMTGADAQVGDTKAKLAKDRKQEVEQNKANPGVAIMGVALYNTDGPGYPFTCG
jgi:ribosomally synthesized peptide (two-chain TOMM family)